MNRLPLSILCALLLAGGVAVAQPQASDKPTAKPHEHPHPTVQDPSRFFTNRKSPVDLPLPGEKNAFFFAVLGDRTGGPAEGVKVLAEAVGEINLLEPDLVMTVGDLIQGYNQTDGWMEQMKEYKGIMNRLKMPWFPVAGNHDVYWRGDNRPAGEHEASYETHFGPLWYAFSHKNSMFITLYSDEGDAKGRKNFRSPAAQKMSPAQLAWLDGILTKAKTAEHVFVFLHHPRWLGGGYGDDWNQVHERLVKAGNVTAVFAGHIHRMRYDGNKDGIEYFTLATTGGGQSGIAPKAGYLHHYHIVTVREGRIAVSAVPVGEVMDVRAITGEISDAARTLRDTAPQFDKALAVSELKPLDDLVTLTLKNPVGRPLEFSLTPHSLDGRFGFSPDHTHLVLAPGTEGKVTFRVTRPAAPIDAAFSVPAIEVEADYLATGARIRILETAHVIPMFPADSGTPRGRPAPKDQSLTLRSGDAPFVIPAAQADFKSESFTVEGWLKAEKFTRRQGFLCKTENSEYGIFVSRGKADFSVHVDGKYVTARAPDDIRLETGRWHHIAGAFSGEKVLLWIDGKLVATAERSGKRTRNRLPLVIGADVNRAGRSTSPFLGEIDDVRITAGVRYPEGDFTPKRRLTQDRKTLLLLDFDKALGPWYPDHSGQKRHAIREQKATSTGGH